MPCTVWSTQGAQNRSLSCRSCRRAVSAEPARCTLPVPLTQQCLTLTLASNFTRTSKALEGTHLATASGDSTVKLWSFAQQKCVATLKGHAKAHHLNPAVQGTHLATASGDSTVKLWSFAQQKCVATLKNQARPQKPHAAVQGTHLATASGDSTVKLWSFAQQKCVATLKGHAQAVWGVDWHDQGGFVASCSLDHSVRIWDFPTGAMRQALR